MGIKPTNMENEFLPSRGAIHFVAVQNGSTTLDFIKNYIPLTREDLMQEMEDILDELFPIVQEPEK